MSANSLTVTQRNKEGLTDLEKIIKDGQKLTLLTTFGTFAVVFSSGFKIGTVINIASTDWKQLGEAAKAINVMTRQLCYQHCTFMYMETGDSFWETLGNTFL